MLWKVGSAVTQAMGVRAVNMKIDMMESALVIMKTTKTQKLGAGMFSGGCF